MQKNRSIFFTVTSVLLLFLCAVSLSTANAAKGVGGHTGGAHATSGGHNGGHSGGKSSGGRPGVHSGESSGTGGAKTSGSSPSGNHSANGSGSGSFAVHNTSNGHTHNGNHNSGRINGAIPSSSYKFNGSSGHPLSSVYIIRTGQNVRNTASPKNVPRLNSPTALRLKSVEFGNKNVVAKEAVHKNSRNYVGETHVYAVRNPNGRVNKIGESATGTRVRDGASKRAEQQVRKLNREVGPGHTSEIRKTFPNKDAARNHETNLIERYRRMYGRDSFPGNKTNR